MVLPLLFLCGACASIFMSSKANKKRSNIKHTCGYDGCGYEIKHSFNGYFQVVHDATDIMIPCPTTAIMYFI
eukprot:Pgem_evm1s5735